MKKVNFKRKREKMVSTKNEFSKERRKLERFQNLICEKI